MKKAVPQEYLEKARLLSREEAEHVFSRFRPKLTRRLEDKDISPLEAVALQLLKEDQDLEEWRARWAEVKERDSKKQKKRGPVDWPTGNL